MVSYDQEKIRYDFKRNVIPVLSHTCNFPPTLTPEKCTDIQGKFSTRRDISGYLSSEAVELGRSWSTDVECGFDFAPCTCVIRHVRGHPVCVKCATTSVVNTSISGSVVSFPSDKLYHYVLVTCG